MTWEGLDSDSTMAGFPDTPTGRVLASASNGRENPPPASEADMTVVEKPCPACACISPRVEVKGEKAYKCRWENCGIGYFTHGWNEFRTEESFLGDIQIDGWRLNDER